MECQKSFFLGKMRKIYITNLSWASRVAKINTGPGEVWNVTYVTDVKVTLACRFIREL